MTTLEKINKVASSDELYMIELEYRTVIDDYNKQSMTNYKSIYSMFDAMTRNILQKIQKDTHSKFGSDGMVLVSQILPEMGLHLNHHILNK